MASNSDPNRLLEAIESFLCIRFDNLAEQGKSSTKQTILSQLVSYGFSALAIVSSIVIATDTNKFWLIALTLVITIVFSIIYYVLFQKYESSTAKHTDSLQANLEAIRDFNVLTVGKLDFCQNQIRQFKESSLKQEEKIALYYSIYENCDTALVVLEKIFKASYAIKLIGMKPNSQQCISLYRLEGSIERLRRTIDFLVAEFYSCLDGASDISAEAQMDIFYVLVPYIKNTRTLVSRYNSLLDDMSTLPKTKYIPNRTQSERFQQQVYQKPKCLGITGSKHSNRV